MTDKIECDADGSPIRLFRHGSVTDLGRLFDCLRGHRFVSYKPVNACPECGMPAQLQAPDKILARALKHHPQLKFPDEDNAVAVPGR